jgi:HEXXH motif-containing protein
VAGTALDITSDLIETDLVDLRRVSFEKISSGSPPHLLPGSTRHRLSAASFAVLCAGDGGAPITRAFWNTEESRRLLLVSTLLTEIGRNPACLGPLPPVAGVVDALAAALRNGPTGVRRLLLEPQAGTGCGYALRRLRGGAGGEPLWADLGVVHELALAAAASAGLTWSTRLPVRHGTVRIHGLGVARFGAGGAATVEAHTEDGDIRLSDGVHEMLLSAGASAPDDRWSPPHHVRVGGELPFTVRLDDRAGPARLGPAAVRRWHRLIGAAWELLCHDHRREAEAMAAGVVSIVPGGAPDDETFGRIVLAEPPDAVTMAVSLIREYRRLEFGALTQLVPLTGPDDGSLHYAPWRDDPCPLAGLVQGVYASFGITRFWQIHRDTADGAFEYAYARRQTDESIDAVLAAEGLTARGRQLFEGLRDRLGPADAVDPGIDRLAKITADSHRIGWRLRHFRPRDSDVAALAGRWAQHRTPQPRSPAPAAISPHPAPQWAQRIPAVARRQARGTAGTPNGGGDPLTAGENALLARDPQAARTAFAGAIGQYLPAGPEVPDEETRAWAGLAMSLAAAGDTAAATALSRRPDLVRAVYTATGRDTTPAAVAEWLAPVLTGPA